MTLTRYVYFPVMSSSEKTRSLPFPFEKESQFWLLSTHQKRVKIVEVIHDVLEQDTMDPIVQKVLSIFYITCSIYWHSNHFMSILCFAPKNLELFLGLKRSFRKSLFFLSSPSIERRHSKVFLQLFFLPFWKRRLWFPLGDFEGLLLTGSSKKERS